LNTALSYNQVAQNKPTAAAVLSILAGVFGLVFAIIAFIGIFYIASIFVEFEVGTFLAIAIAEAVWILISAILVLVGGVKIRSHPESHTKWGVVILLFSIIGLGLLVLSIPAWTGFVGLIITILGIVGGILALVFKPVFVQQPVYAPQQSAYPPPQQPTWGQQPQQQQVQRPITRICPQCGRVIDENIKFCPHCGKQLG